MKKKRIFFFVKTFEKQDHANDFLDGTLYMNTLNYFKSLEDTGDGRDDRCESATALFQSNKIINIDINGIKVNPSDLVDRVVIHKHSLLAKHVFCLHAGCVDGAKQCTTAAFKRQLRIPPKNISLGQVSVLITDVNNFLEKVKNAVILQNMNMRRRLVEYYNPNKINGIFPDENAAFQKRKCFSHQKEFRFLIESNLNNSSPLKLPIGSIREISTIMSIKDLNKGLKVNPLNVK
jgi:hypothetical protein